MLDAIRLFCLAVNVTSGGSGRWTVEIGREGRVNGGADGRGNAEIFSETDEVAVGASFSAVRTVSSVSGSERMMGGSGSLPTGTAGPGHAREWPFCRLRTRDHTKRNWLPRAGVGPQNAVTSQ